MRVKRRMNIFIVLSIRTQRLSQHSDESMPAVLAGACVGEYIADHRGKAEGQKVSRGRPVAEVDRLARLCARCHTVRGNHLTPQVLEEDTVCDNRHVFETHCGPLDIELLCCALVDEIGFEISLGEHDSP